MENEQSNPQDAGALAVAYEESLALALVTGAEPNFCYANVWHALNELETLAQAHLIEGWLVWEQALCVAVIEHCWIEARNGAILDPSIVLLAPRSQPLCYFSGIRRETSQVVGLPCDALPLVRSLGTFGLDGLGHADYRAAWKAALAQAEHLAAVHLPPKKIVLQPARFPGAAQPEEPLVGRIVSFQAFFSTQLRRFLPQAEESGVERPERTDPCW